jgi:hypothetical protein
MASVKGMLGKWVKARVKKLSMKQVILRAGDEVVKATKSKDDDRAWAEMRDWIDANWK